MVRWSGWPFASDVEAAVRSWVAEAGFDPDVVSVVNVWPWSCSRFHRSAGAAWVFHVVAAASYDFGGHDDCGAGCWFSEEGVTREKLAEVAPEHAEALWALSPIRFSEHGDGVLSDGTEFVSLEDLEEAAEVLGLCTPIDVCRPEHFAHCGRCGSCGYLLDSGDRRPCGACGGRLFDLSDPAQLEIWQTTRASA